MKKKVNVNNWQSWLKIGLVAISAVVFALFWLVGYDMPYQEDADFNAPLLTDVLIGYVYLLTAAAVGVAVFSAIHGTRTRSRQGGVENGVPTARINTITWIITVLLLAGSFACATTEPIKVNGKLYSETIWLRLSDMFIVTSGVMILLAVIAVAFGMSGYSRRLK